MKVNSSRLSAACIAVSACLAAILLFTSCAGSSVLTAETVNALATKPVSFELQTKIESESVRLVIQKPVGKIVRVRFIDIDNIVLESFWSGKQEETIDRSYNFEGAEEGVYRFEIYDGVKIIAKTVKLQRQDSETITRLVIE